MRELYEKMISEAMAAQKADIEVISKNRYNSFKISDAKPYADAVSKMKARNLVAKIKSTKIVKLDWDKASNAEKYTFCSLVEFSPDSRLFK